MTIPVVQGVVVAGEPVRAAQPTGGYYQAAPAPTSTQYVNANSSRPEPQPKQFQDVIWAVLFVVHLVVVIVMLAMNMSGAQSNGMDYSGVIFVVGTTGVMAVGISSFALGFMMRYADELVKMALIFSVLASLAVGILGLMAGQLLMGILGLVSFAIGICYAYMVWSRIPFAAANMNTALTAVKANMGLSLISYGLTGVAFAWSIFWVLGFGDAINSLNSVMIFLLLLSYYWVHQVLQNTIHVTVAGTIGTWWFVPDEASSFCSPALNDSFIRSVTYSFGSICLGSLLVAIVQALRALSRISRDNEDFNFLTCMIDCILGCIEGIIEYLNKWAYIYVGLYGFPYLEAGRNVITLFENKGWTAIITDDLVDNVLFMVSIGIGFATGLIGLIMGTMDKNLFAGVGYENAGLAAFLIGLLVGFLFASILMSVVGSAVNTVIVCFAESPAEFEANHPQLSAQMRAAWVQAWPGLAM